MSRGWFSVAWPYTCARSYTQTQNYKTDYHLILDKEAISAQKLCVYKRLMVCTTRLGHPLYAESYLGWQNTFHFTSLWNMSELEWCRLKVMSTNVFWITLRNLWTEEEGNLHITYISQAGPALGKRDFFFFFLAHLQNDQLWGCGSHRIYPLLPALLSIFTLPLFISFIHLHLPPIL